MHVEDSFDILTAFTVRPTLILQRVLHSKMCDGRAAKQNREPVKD